MYQVLIDPILIAPSLIAPSLIGPIRRVTRYKWGNPNITLYVSRSTHFVSL